MLLKSNKYLMDFKALGNFWYPKDKGFVFLCNKALKYKSFRR